MLHILKKLGSLLLLCILSLLFTFCTDTKKTTETIPITDNKKDSNIALDSDGDGIIDSIDICPNTDPSLIPSFKENDADANGCHTNEEDDDGDGIIDSIDICPNTDPSLVPFVAGDDTDANGCHNDEEDDDGDRVLNADDICPNTDPSLVPFVAGDDTDADGCHSDEEDDDGDKVLNANDICPNTDPSLVPFVAGDDTDADGCHTNEEDNDRDGVPDVVDICPNTDPSLVPFETGDDTDANGCHSDEEDNDRDGVPDVVDICPNTDPSLVPFETGDDTNANGCHTNEEDDDGDKVLNADDICPNTDPSLVPFETGDDTDANGCHTNEEDDDGDGVPDVVDICPNTDPSLVPFETGDDTNADGCHSDEEDDDGDKVLNANDICPNTDPSLVPFETGDDTDANGCHSDEEDDDGDRVLNADDICPNTDPSLVPFVAGDDTDANGCHSDEEDDDGDRVLNADDICPNTDPSLIPSFKENDADANGCHTNEEDTDDDGVLDINDSCINTDPSLVPFVAGDDADANGCHTNEEDDDGDGVFNINDSCINTDPSLVPFETGDDTDADGCHSDEEKLNIVLAGTINPPLNQQVYIGNTKTLTIALNPVPQKKQRIRIIATSLAEPSSSSEIQFHSDLGNQFLYTPNTSLTVPIYFFKKNANNSFDTAENIEIRIIVEKRAQEENIYKDLVFQIKVLPRPNTTINSSTRTVSNLDDLEYNNNNTKNIYINQSLTLRPSLNDPRITYSSGSLPAGLNINPRTGILYGKTNALGMHSIMITANADGIAPHTTELTLNVESIAYTNKQQVLLLGNAIADIELETQNSLPNTQIEFFIDNFPLGLTGLDSTVDSTLEPSIIQTISGTPQEFGSFDASVNIYYQNTIIVDGDIVLDILGDIVPRADSSKVPLNSEIVLMVGTKKNPIKNPINSKRDFSNLLELRDTSGTVIPTNSPLTITADQIILKPSANLNASTSYNVLVNGATLFSFTTSNLNRGAIGTRNEGNDAVGVYKAETIQNILKLIISFRDSLQKIKKLIDDAKKVLEAYNTLNAAALLLGQDPLPPPLITSEQIEQAESLVQKFESLVGPLLTYLSPILSFPNLVNEIKYDLEI